jgi:hypothetical protein
MIEKAQQLGFITRMTVIKGKKGISRKHSNRIKKKKKFQNWCMPEQITGYIKSRAHDFF